MKLRKRTNAYWQKRSTERVALLERQSEPYTRKVFDKSLFKPS